MTRSLWVSPARSILRNLYNPYVILWVSAVWKWRVIYLLVRKFFMLLRCLTTSELCFYVIRELCSQEWIWLGFPVFLPVCINNAPNLLTFLYPARIRFVRVMLAVPSELLNRFGHRSDFYQNIARFNKLVSRYTGRTQENSAAIKCSPSHARSVHTKHSTGSVLSQLIDPNFESFWTFFSAGDAPRVLAK